MWRMGVDARGRGVGGMLLAAWLMRIVMPARVAGVCLQMEFTTMAVVLSIILVVLLPVVVLQSWLLFNLRDQQRRMHGRLDAAATMAARARAAARSQGAAAPPLPPLQRTSPPPIPEGSRLRSSDAGGHVDLVGGSALARQARPAGVHRSPLRAVLRVAAGYRRLATDLCRPAHGRVDIERVGRAQPGDDRRVRVRAAYYLAAAASGRSPRRTRSRWFPPPW